MDRLRLTMCLKHLNEAHEELTTKAGNDYTASDLRLLDAVDGAIDTALQVMASNRAIEKAIDRGNS